MTTLSSFRNGTLGFVANLIWVLELDRWMWVGGSAIDVNDIVGFAFAFVECQTKVVQYPEADLPDFRLSTTTKKNIAARIEIL